MRASTSRLTDAPALRPAKQHPTDLLTRVFAVGYWLRRHRRRLGALALALAALLALETLRPPRPATATVLAATRDLTAGQRLAAGDLRAERLPVTDLPAGALSSLPTAAGRSLSAPMRRGEVLTDVRLIDQTPLAPLNRGLVATPVRLADAQAAALLRPGQHVDVLAATTSDPVAGAPPRSADVLVADVQVVAIPATGGADDVNSADAAGDDPDDAGLLVLLATTVAQAATLAQAEVSDRLSAVVVG